MRSKGIDCKVNTNDLIINEKHVTYRLLIELLAHQFAFPVQWIETQNELYSKEEHIQRFIELGPSKILAGMAKRTGAAKFRARDTSLLISRQFLSTSHDSKDIRYDYEQPQMENIKPNLEDGGQKPLPQSISLVAPERLKAHVETPPKRVVAPKITDTPISTLHIMQALVAQKLRRPFEQVSSAKSIKELTGGKSTQQNELLGDLGNEFGSLPDGPEDLPLKSLADLLESNFSGQLGKQSSKLISRVISAKMPAGFNTAALRGYLGQTWGLGPSGQDLVMLLAATEEPPLRLASIEAAKKYTDLQIARYGTLKGIVMQPVLPDILPSGTSALVDVQQVVAFRKEQEELQMKQLRVLARHLGIDILGDTTRSEIHVLQEKSQEMLDLWNSEFSEDFAKKISPIFDSLKARFYNSWWNLVRQDVLELYQGAKLKNLGDEKRVATIVHSISNRATEDVKLLLHEVSSRYIEGDVESDITSMSRKLAVAVEKAIHEDPVFKFSYPLLAPRTTISEHGRAQYSEVNRFESGSEMSYVDMLTRGGILGFGDKMPLISIKRKQGADWIFDTLMTTTFINSLLLGSDQGISFAGRDFLVTGAGPGSIGAEVVRGLLMGGARVIVTTSKTVSDNASYFQSLYDENGARGSELLVIPFNQASKQDCESLINHIFSDSGLARSLDAILPFAAVPEMGVELESIGSKSELAHRLMLVNLLRLLGCVVKCKQERQLYGRPTQVLLPLSPNHGIFGGDGLYSESKLGLEALMNRFHSESWSELLSITGAVIGWTRSTGLMSDNDIVAEEVESQGAFTFSRQEMAFNILGLMSGPMANLSTSQPLWADFGGGLHLIHALKKTLSDYRAQTELSADIRRAIKEEDDKEAKLSETAVLEQGPASVDQHPQMRTTLQIGFPEVPEFEKIIKPLQDLQGMVDPSKTIVIVGISELGPWGSARTRWEMEAHGKFTQEGYIEMAWMMNMIRHVDGDLKGSYYVGWVDSQTGEFVQDSDIPAKYGSLILQHSGIRMIEKDISNAFDPSQMELLHEVAIDQDLEFDSTLASAEAFKLRHGDKVSIRKASANDEYKILVKAGSHIMIPKSISSDTLVAAQIPKGWNGTKYGIPADLVPQIDPVTLFVLCCACECLYSAGIVDPLEIFKHIHPSELGNFIGTAMGGTTKTRQMYKDRYLDKTVQGDILQETYLNTSAAWMNMLLLGSTGPIKTPTGTCATGVESIDSACESILAGKTKLCFVGGFDDFQEDEIYGFATMKATVNAADEFAKGRLPHEMSRPMTKSRAGFVESQGCGMQMLTTGELALAMGLPIYGIIAASTMAADKIGRSVPAPGQGVLTFARESPSAALSPLLNLQYRREQLLSMYEVIRAKRRSALKKLRSLTLNPDSSEKSWPRHSVDQEGEIVYRSKISAINAFAKVQYQDAQNIWGNGFRSQNPDISPLRASLSVWGLTIDDISVVSMHGTSTQANDRNEADVVNQQMRHLRRKPGRPLFAVCQKSLTGHPKAPAASWMLNGCLQTLRSGLVPGNRNADNIDEEFRNFEHLFFPTKTIQISGVKAFLLDSFGFGQKGGQIVGVAPEYFLATVTRDVFEEYSKKVSARRKCAGRAYTQSLMSNALFKVKASPAYLPGDEPAIFLDPLARVSVDVSGESLFFDRGNLHPSSANVAESEGDVASLCDNDDDDNEENDLAKMANDAMAWTSSAISEVDAGAVAVAVGIDTEQISCIKSDNEIFIGRNFSVEEQVQANSSSNPRSAFAGKWSAKEAVFKSLRVHSKGAGAAMNDIEILQRGNAPIVVLHGEAATTAQTEGIQSFKLRITHNRESVIAVALAIRKRK